MQVKKQNSNCLLQFRLSEWLKTPHWLRGKTSRWWKTHQPANILTFSGRHPIYKVFSEAQKKLFTIKVTFAKTLTLQTPNPVKKPSEKAFQITETFSNTKKISLTQTIRKQIQKSLSFSFTITFTLVFPWKKIKYFYQSDKTKQ